MIRDLRRETAGNVFPIAAVGMIVAAGVIGAAVDFGRDYRVQNQLQAACDAAVLAGRRSVSTNGYDDAAKQVAIDYFATNFDDTNQETTGTSFVTSADDKGNTVSGTARTTLSTLVMRLFNYNTFELTAYCSASMGVGNADVMMVLDTTGSMGSTLSAGQTRIQALRAAMKNFYTTLSDATDGTNARVRYGFVPYSSSVNVGKLLYDLNPAYLVDTREYQSREAQYDTSTSNEVTGYSDPTVVTNPAVYSNYDTSSWAYYDNVRYNNSSQCQAALPSNDADYANYGTAQTVTKTTTNSAGQKVVTTTVTQSQRKATYDCYRKTSSKYYVIVQYQTRDVVTVTVSTSDPIYDTTENKTFTKWVYKPVEYDVSAYKAFNAVTMKIGSDSQGKPKDVTSTWAGCIEERSTTPAANFGYNSSAGITPVSAWDVKIDDAPTADDDTKWAPMWPEVAYRRWDKNGSYDKAESDYGGQAPSYCPQKSQLLAEMDQDSFDTYADSLNATGNTYLDIGMIWGGRLLSPDGIFQDNVNIQPLNGGEVSRHIIFMTDGVMEPNYSIQSAWGMEYWDRRVTANGYNDDAGRHSQRFLAVCEALKDKGIRIWVIAFTSGLSTDLKTCSSDNSSYTANNADELNTAFQEIAKQVGELRITQ